MSVFIPSSDLEDLNHEMQSMLAKNHGPLYFAIDGSLIDSQGRIYIQSASKNMIKVSEFETLDSPVFGCLKTLTNKDLVRVKVFLWPYQYDLGDQYAYTLQHNQPVCLSTLLKSFAESFSTFETKIKDFYSKKNLPFTHLQSVYFYRLEKRYTKQGNRVLCLQLQVF